MCWFRILCSSLLESCLVEESGGTGACECAEVCVAQSGARRDAFENVALLGNCVARNSCMFRIFAGGRGLQGHAKGTPHCLQPPLCSPSPSLELMNGLNTINATFFSPPSLLRALLYLSEDFWECDVCV